MVEATLEKQCTYMTLCATAYTLLCDEILNFLHVIFFEFKFTGYEFYEDKKKTIENGKADFIRPDDLIIYLNVK